MKGKFIQSWICQMTNSLILTNCNKLASGKKTFLEAIWTVTKQISCFVNQHIGKIGFLIRLLLASWLRLYKLPAFLISSCFSFYYLCINPLCSITFITFESFLHSACDNQIDTPCEGLSVKHVFLQGSVVQAVHELSHFPSDHLEAVQEGSKGREIRHYMLEEDSERWYNLQYIIRVSWTQSWVSVPLVRIDFFFFYFYSFLNIFQRIKRKFPHF